MNRARARYVGRNMLLYSVRRGRNSGTFTAQYVLARTNLIQCAKVSYKV